MNDFALGFTLFLVAVTSAGLAWLTTWDYWRRHYNDLLLERAEERRAMEEELSNVKIREQVYRDVTIGDVVAKRNGVR